MKPYDEFKEKLKEISHAEIKPRLLLHSCCGPCSTYVIKLLQPYFDITIFYYNPNIFPNSEFDLRLETQKKLLSQLPFEVDLIVEHDSHRVFLDKVEPYKDLGEKSIRCYECYKFRMLKLKEVACKLGFDYFTTTLSVSPHKNSDWINEIGNSISMPNCQYLYSNFKKENGYLESTTLAKKYDLYRQDYCGCEFSLHESLLKKEENSKN